MKKYLQENRFKILVALVAIMAGVFGWVDGAAAAAGLVFIGDVEPTNLKELNLAMKAAFDKLQGNIAESQDLAQKAIDEIKRGDALHADTNDKLKKVGEETQKSQKELLEKFNSLSDRTREMEQKYDKRFTEDRSAANAGKSAGELFVESEQYKILMKNTNSGASKTGWNGEGLDVNRKTAILNPVTPTNDQPLVRADRLSGIIGPGLRRFTVRDLLPNLRTGSNLVEYARELLFTSSAAPQYDSSSPDATRDGALKAESTLTFELVNAPVITIAHYIPASRQIMADAQALAGYINARLIYGLKIEEEDELLNASGTAGKLNGIRNQQTTFSGGATNQTAIDTLLKAFTQVSLSYFEASGAILHPTDWQNILLLKDTQNRYLFSDPHSMNSASIWGKPVVATQAMTQGQFTVGAFDLAAAIFDREDVTIRTAEQHSDWFARNLVAILCEERLALAFFRATAVVGGAISYAG
jgi:HK97 family phage major capsid protein